MHNFHQMATVVNDIVMYKIPPLMFLTIQSVSTMAVLPAKTNNRRMKAVIVAKKKVLEKKGQSRQLIGRDCSHSLTWMDCLVRWLRERCLMCLLCPAV